MSPSMILAFSLCLLMCTVSSIPVPYNTETNSVSERKLVKNLDSKLEVGHLTSEDKLMAEPITKRLERTKRNVIKGICPDGQIWYKFKCVKDGNPDYEEYNEIADTDS